MILNLRPGRFGGSVYQLPALGDCQNDGGQEDGLRLEDPAKPMNSVGFNVWGLALAGGGFGFTASEVLGKASINGRLTNVPMSDSWKTPPTDTARPIAVVSERSVSGCGLMPLLRF